MKINSRKKRFKEVLIYVAGTTPQIITETIYALIHKKPAIYPEELYIITTVRGKEAIKKRLLESGIFKDFCKEFNLDENMLNDESIVIVNSRRKKSFDDIKSDKDNEMLGDFISDFIRSKTQDDTVRLHCSLAGGRKTMSFYIGSALQFFGRPWDKLYHVLVTPEFESNPAFYYKPKKNKILKSNGKSLNTRDAHIYLAELPFIRLKDKISLEGRGFRALVEEGQKNIDTAMVQPELLLKLQSQTITIGQKTVKLTPMQIMIYSAYLKYKLNHCRYPDRPYCLDCSDCYPSLLDMGTKTALEEMAKDYMIISPSRADDLLFKYKEGLPFEVIRQAISKIKKTMRENLIDETLSSYYAITTSLRSYSNTKHGVRVEKGKIRII